MQDRQGRKTERQYLGTLARLDDGHGPISLPILDVSPGGIFLESDLLLEEGECYRVEFEIPGTRTTVSGQGEVVRVQGVNGRPVHPGMGMRFVELESDGAAALGSWLGSQADPGCGR